MGKNLLVGTMQAKDAKRAFKAGALVAVWYRKQYKPVLDVNGNDGAKVRFYFDDGGVWEVAPNRKVECLLDEKKAGGWL